VLVDVDDHRVRIIPGPGPGGQPGVRSTAQAPLVTYASLVAQPRAVSNGTILVVEDQADIQMTLRLSLEVDGYDVVVTSNAAEALDAIERSTPDVTLLDITLPGMSGWDLLSKLRADRRYASLPIIVLSALPPAQVSLRAKELGATAYLTKPFDVVQLADVVHAALEGRRA